MNNLAKIEKHLAEMSKLLDEAERGTPALYESPKAAAHTERWDCFTTVFSTSWIAAQAREGLEYSSTLAQYLKMSRGRA